jgi:hypothetical protein
MLFTLWVLGILGTTIVLTALIETIGKIKMRQQFFDSEEKHDRKVNPEDR